MPEENDAKTRHARRDTRLRKAMVLAIWLVGLLLPSLLGLYENLVMHFRGVPTVNIGRGVTLIVPLTIFYLTPFAILALIVGRILRGAEEKEHRLSLAYIFVSTGALVGLSIAAGWNMFGVFSYDGPGGLAEAVGMTLALWMITLPVLLTVGLAGVIGGGLVGALLWLIVSPILARYHPGWR